MLTIAYSPCPNDTFTFHAWAHGLIENAPPIEVTYADINITNTWATEADAPDILKISYAALPWVLDRYALLPCGGALGRGCGPLVLVAGPEGSAGTSVAPDAAGTPGASTPGAQGASAAQSDLTPASPHQLIGKRVAVPSDRSTAYLLFRFWAAQCVPGGLGEIVVMPFHEIMPAVRDGRIDAGLVIHEARFTYPDYGLSLVADLGTWWEADTGLPIPLGAIIAKRGLDHRSIADAIRASVAYAWDHPEASSAYVLQHAQEMDPEVAKSHIALYVNEFTADLGAAGYEAAIALLGRAAEQGLVPAADYRKLLQPLES